METMQKTILCVERLCYSLRKLALGLWSLFNLYLSCNEWDVNSVSVAMCFNHLLPSSATADTFLRSSSVTRRFTIVHQLMFELTLIYVSKRSLGFIKKKSYRRGGI